MRTQAFEFGIVVAILLAACAPLAAGPTPAQLNSAGPTQAQLSAAANDSTNWLYVDHDRHDLPQTVTPPASEHDS